MVAGAGVGVVWALAGAGVVAGVVVPQAVRTRLATTSSLIKTDSFLFILVWAPFSPNCLRNARSSLY